MTTFKSLIILRDNIFNELRRCLKNSPGYTGSVDYLMTALGSGTGSRCLMTETDSPVRIDWSILEEGQSQLRFFNLSAPS